MRTRVGVMHSALAVSRGADDAVRARLRFGPPDNRAHAALGVSGVIARRAEMAVLLVGLTRYTAGLQIELALRCGLDADLGDGTHSTVDAGLFAGSEAADGRIAALTGRDARNNWPAADQPVLIGDRELSNTLWLTPVPPPRAPVLVVADPPSAWIGRVSSWMPRHFEPRPRRLRSYGRASLSRRFQPTSRRSTYRPGAISHGYFRR
jgi:hypothetical protein